MRFLLALILSLLPGFAGAQTIDYNIANQAFAAFRTDLNNHLEAIVEQNAGTVAPSTTFPYMVWADTSGATPVYKYRNAANSGWATAFRVDPTATVWLGSVSTASAVITGGSVNNTPVGNITPSTGQFTDLISIGGAPGLRLREAGTATTHNQVWIVQDSNTLLFQSRNDAGSLVGTDYVMSRGTSGATSHSFRISNVERLNIGAVNTTINSILIPGSTLSIGQSGNRFSTIFLTGSPDVSSDERVKNSIEDVAEAECRVADRIEIRRYRLNAEDDGPWHFGAIAQEVIAAFDAEGLDWQDYAIVTGSEADGYGVVYDELQNLKLACL